MQIVLHVPHFSNLLLVLEHSEGTEGKMIKCSFYLFFLDWVLWESGLCVSSQCESSACVSVLVAFDLKTTSLQPNWSSDLVKWVCPECCLSLLRNAVQNASATLSGPSLHCVHTSPESGLMRCLHCEHAVVEGVTATGPPPPFVCADWWWSDSYCMCCCHQTQWFTSRWLVELVFVSAWCH